MTITTSLDFYRKVFEGPLKIATSRVKILGATRSEHLRRWLEHGIRVTGKTTLAWRQSQWEIGSLRSSLWRWAF